LLDGSAQGLLPLPLVKKKREQTFSLGNSSLARAAPITNSAASGKGGRGFRGSRLFLPFSSRRRLPEKKNEALAHTLLLEYRAATFKADPYYLLGKCN